MSVEVPPGWVAYKHAVTGEIRAINPFDVRALRALKREPHPQQWDRSAWDQINIATPGIQPWNWRSPA